MKKICILIGVLYVSCVILYMQYEKNNIKPTFEEMVSEVNSDLVEFIEMKIDYKEVSQSNMTIDTIKKLIKNDHSITAIYLTELLESSKTDKSKIVSFCAQRIKENKSFLSFGDMFSFYRSNHRKYGSVHLINDLINKEIWYKYETSYFGSNIKIISLGDYVENGDVREERILINMSNYKENK